MPIKYNLTKYDMLAEEIHEIAHKKDDQYSRDKEITQAEATLIASFASSHSWQTHKVISNGNINALNSNEIRNEFFVAENESWKHIRNMDIQEVACMNIKDGLFYMWLSVNCTKLNKDLYKQAWLKLKEEFNEVCDGVSIQSMR